MKADDKWLDDVNTGAARDMVSWLKATVNVRRAIETLTLDELKPLAVVVWSYYIKALSIRKAQPPEPTPEQTEQLELWLG